MFKRRDWLLMHGADGGGSSDDDTSSEEGEPPVAEETSSDESSESDDSEVPAGGGAESDDGEAAFGDDGGLRRLEDLSEDDFTDDERTEELEDHLKSWVDAPPGETVKGKAIKCIVCDGALILNAKTLQQHLVSKKHRKNVRAAIPPDVDADEDDFELHQLFCFAEDYVPEEEEAETHQERLERLKTLLAKENVTAQGEVDSSDDEAPAAAAPAKPKTGSAKRKARKLKKEASAKGERPARKRPGKRQRAALKEDAVVQGKDGKEGSKKGKAKPKPKQKGAAAKAT